MTPVVAPVIAPACGFAASRAHRRFPPFDRPLPPKMAWPGREVSRPGLRNVLDIKKDTISPISWGAELAEPYTSPFISSYTQ
jgi:hypothetical protein